MRPPESSTGGDFVRCDMFKKGDVYSRSAGPQVNPLSRLRISKISDVAQPDRRDTEKNNQISSGERRNGTGLATDLIVNPMSRLTVPLFVTTVVGDQCVPS